MKGLCRHHYQVWDPMPRRAIIEESLVFNQDWIKN